MTTTPAADRPITPLRAPVPDRVPLSLVCDTAARAARPATHRPPGTGGWDDLVRRAVVPVLADLAFPARRWQVLAESDAWGASGPIRRLLADIPDCSYRDLDTIVEMVCFLVRRRPQVTRLPSVR